MTDRRTKQQLLDELAGARDERDAAINEAELQRAFVDELDLEAKVIAGCIAHLELLPEPEPIGGRNLTEAFAYDLDAGRPRPLDDRQQAVARVLGYCARRFGLPDPRVEVEEAVNEAARLRADLGRQTDATRRVKRELGELRDRMRGLAEDAPDETY